MAGAAAAGAGTKFQFAIVALDGFTKTFRDLNNQASKSLRPFSTMGRKAAALGREMHLDKAAAGIQKLAQATSALGESLGLASPALRAVGALGFAGGFAGAAAGAGYLAYRVANVGTSLQRTSSRMGMSTDTLQRFRGAAKLAGVDADTMQSSLEALGQTMEDALSNRNPAAQHLFAALTGGIATGPGGVPLPGEQMLRLAQATAGIRNPYARQKLLAEAGVSTDLLPLMTGGRAGLQSLMNQAPVLTPEQIDRAVRFNAELWKMGVAFDNLANQVGVRLLPPITALLDTLGHLPEHPGQTAWNIATAPFRAWSATTDAARNLIGSAFSSGGGSLPLGLSLNNPGNIRNRNGVGFRQYATPEKGLQAMADQLALYQDVHHLDTVQGILARWAPAGDHNDVGAYVGDVTRRTGFGAGQHLDLHDPATLAALMQAMEMHEQGRNPFTAGQYRTAAEHVVRIEILGKVPDGVDVRANVNGAWVPTRIDRSMATHLGVE